MKKIFILITIAIHSGHEVRNIIIKHIVPDNVNFSFNSIQDIALVFLYLFIHELTMKLVHKNAYRILSLIVYIISHQERTYHPPSL